MQLGRMGKPGWFRRRRLSAMPADVRLTCGVIIEESLPAWPALADSCCPFIDQASTKSTAGPGRAENCARWERRCFPPRASDKGMRSLEGRQMFIDASLLWMVVPRILDLPRPCLVLRPMGSVASPWEPIGDNHTRRLGGSMQTVGSGHTQALGDGD
jgi:hypothetical protein